MLNMQHTRAFVAYVLTRFRVGFAELWLEIFDPAAVPEVVELS